WTAPEAAFCRASMRATRVLARALLPAAPTIVRTAAGRTVFASQLLGRPWRQSAEALLEGTHNLASCPGYEPVVRDSLVAAYQWIEPLDVPVTIAWGTRDRLLPPRQAAR